MPFSVSTRSALDGAGTTIPGGVDFIDVSGTGVGPWIICKATLDPAGANVQFVLSNNAAKCDVSSINGVAVGSPSAYGTSPGAVNVGGVNAFVTNTVTVGGTVTANQGSPPWTIQGDSASGAANAGNPVKGGGVFNTTQPTVTTGQTVDAQYTSRGAALVATGIDTFTVAQGGAPWSVSQSGNWTARIVGNAGGIMDAAGQNAASPANELLIAGQFNTTPTAITSGNISPLQLDANGNLLVNIKTPTTFPVSGTVTANQGGAPWTVNPGTAANWGVGATGAAVPANAPFIAALAKTALPAAATDGNLTGTMSDKFGRLVVLPGTIRDLVGTQTTTISNTTETTIVTAGGAGVFNDLTKIIVSNTAASGSDTRIDFRDTTGGAIIFSLEVRGGSNPTGFADGARPIPQTTANTNWTAQLASAVTDIRIFAQFDKNK